MISPSKRVYSIFGLAARILERSHGGEYVEERGHLEIAFVLSTLKNDRPGDDGTLRSV